MSNFESKKRKDIKHFSEIDPLLFLEIFTNGINGSVKFDAMSVKTDGFNLTFGFENGVFFVQTARSDKIYDPEYFLKFQVENNRRKESFIRAGHYVDVWHQLFNAFVLTDVRKYDWRISADVLYSPMASEVLTDGSVVFVNLPYKTSRKRMIISYYDFELVDIYQNPTRKLDVINQIQNSIKTYSDQIVLLKANTDNQISVNFVDLFLSPTKIEYFKKILTEDNGSETDFYRAWVVEDINKYVKIIADSVLYNRPVNAFTEYFEFFGHKHDIEGIVFSIAGHQFKVTTPEFRSAWRRKREKLG